jgi:hypothetical protein
MDGGTWGSQRFPMMSTTSPTPSSPSSATSPAPASVGAHAVEPVAELSAAGRRFGDVIALTVADLDPPPPEGWGSGVSLTDTVVLHFEFVVVLKV